MTDTGFALFGTDLFGEPIQPAAKGVIHERFTMPPFSVLDGRCGEWQDRKDAWKAIGIKGEHGRQSNLLRMSKTVTLGEKDTSIFDPVLCELAYSWFCPSGGQVVDPFAGGSVRGVVASCLGYRYWGCDLRQEQIESNEDQAREICSDPMPEWACGDSTEVLADSPKADFLFSCPPYGDLERYSDNPKDLSTMEYHTFTAAYRLIIMKALARLKDNRFACFVVGDFRDAKGFLRDFVSETIRAFTMQGAQLYNDFILVIPVGSASLRVANGFVASRKMCRTHQNVLVFCKGDPRLATRAIEVHQ